MAQTPSASASYSTRAAGWDVFLSFHSSDTRLNFTSHLYSALDRHGVRTFMDCPKVHPNEDVGVQAIKESKTYVVVLSENYASSRSCLDELVEIFSCQKTMNRSIIGVYYNIDPAAVTLQIGNFVKAYKKHEARAGTRFLRKASTGHKAKMEKVNNWCRALTEGSYSEGVYISAERIESDAIKEVVDKVLLIIKPMNLDVAKFPVGLDSGVIDITALMKYDTRIGIHGMGGVGKTTLAKAVYNQNCYHFQGSCFLENVRDASVSKRGLVSLQQQLINDVLKCKNINIDNVDQGIELIRARICSIKVLIVIDDLDDPRPLEFLEGPFALGSITIITTRNEDLLDSIKVETKYKVNELCDTESRQLFTQHAYGEHMPKRFAELSQEILEHAGGLPLALEVFGSSVFNKSEEELMCVKKLIRVSIADVEKKLVLSFDALELIDPVLQDIFLDVACFFVGQNKEEVVKIMKTCYQYVNPSIDILIKRCLLTTNDRDELGMHNLIRDMGREIARNNSPDEPGKHSRLWASKEICDVLNNYKGTEAIEGIYYKVALKGDSFSTATFKRMTKLRFLYLKKVNLIGSYEQTFEELRWFCWDCCPLECLPSEFYSQKLVILALPRSNIRTMWEPNMAFEMLKTLDMKYSLYLTTTPNFTRLPCLETLILEHCKSLEEVHISIGSSARLVSFNLRGCVKLRSLPNSICNLRALKSLNVVGCSRLEELPIELGKIESLTELNAEKLSVWNLPDSIRHLSKLVELRLRYSYSLKILPDTICNLRALKLLDIGCCSDLEALPTQFGNIGSLKELNAEGLSVSKLPDSIGRLSKLVKLKLNDNKKLQTLPDTICNLRQLEVLNISYCSSLKALPTEFGNIESLKELNAKGLTVLKLPDSIGCLCNLLELKLDDNPKLQTLPDTICNLRVLEVLNVNSCTSLDALPLDFGNIECLKVLNAEWLNISKLPDSIGRLSKLVEVRLSFNRNLITLPDSICNLRALEVLHIGHCSSLKMLPLELGAIESLKELKAEGLIVQKLPDSIGHLSKLVKLPLGYNYELEILPDTICNLRALEVLDVFGCGKLEKLPDQLWKLTRLKKLKANGATMLKKLPDIKSNEIALSLQKLDLSCSGLTALPSGISQLSNLKYLDLTDCRHLLLIAELPLNLKQLMANGCTSLKSILDLTNFKQLKILGLTSCSGLREIQGLEELTSIRSLCLGGCNSSLLASTFTDHFFQMYSGFGRVIEIYATAAELNSVHQAVFLKSKPGKSKKNKSKPKPKPFDNQYVGDLQPKAAHNFLATILFFTPLNEFESFKVKYHLNTTTSHFNTTTSHFKGKERGLDTPYGCESVMVIVPRSIFLIKDDDREIKLTVKDAEILGIHLLYKTEL